MKYGNRIFQAVIICGGKATRFKGRCKSTLPLPNGKTLIQHQCDLLKESGIKHLVICGGHEFSELGEACQTLSLPYVMAQDTVGLGTAGCVKAVEFALERNFLVVYGDIWFEHSLKPLLEHHHHESVAAIAVRESDHPEDSDAIILDDVGLIGDYVPKAQNPKPKGSFAPVGIFTCSTAIMPVTPVKGDWMTDVFPKTLKWVDPPFTWPWPKHWKILDVGTPDRYLKAYGLNAITQ